ncbi:hypothetical protein FisN_2Hu359 [Fistulifera solaris]|uniref:Uncharacterized protein n=1 Tax=Fistulifera solaris TaxID=1519565 RepID=A0A1Z5KK47_FISSO|nr:hypothetical protein FisN_2Hu359 [Fistulifera solaris]|eukprot:GAX26694.1 hypothetical protein FisN_2Hu359 [Fistulifera solaris]
MELECLSPNDDTNPMPEQHDRSKSCESMPMQTIAILLESSGKLSDVSSSHYSSSSFSSWAAPDSCDDAVLTSLRRNVTFPGHCLSQGFKAKAHQQRTLSRWDSWAERTPRESPKMPSRKGAVNQHPLEPSEEGTAPTIRNKTGTAAKPVLDAETSRWSSHSQSSSRAPSWTPLRSFSPLRKGSPLPHDTSNWCADSRPLALPVKSGSQQDSHKAHNRLMPEKSPKRKPMKMSTSLRRYQYSIA